MTQSDSTLKIYLSNLGTIAKLMGLKEVPENGVWLQDSDAIISKLNTVKNLNTRKNKLNTIIVFANAYEISPKIVLHYTSEVEKISDQINAELGTHEKSDKQTENWMSKAELVSFLAVLKDNIPQKIKSFEDYERMLRYLIVLFHIDYPLRNDLANAKIYLASDRPEINDEINYILLNKRKKTAQLVLNQYKTAKVYGSKTIDLNSTISTALIKYFPTILSFSSDHWFMVKKCADGSTSPVSRNFYTKFMLRTFKSTGKQVSTTMIRHSVVSDVYKIKEMDDLANIMGHSIGTGQQIYAKK